MVLDKLSEWTNNGSKGANKESTGANPGTLLPAPMMKIVYFIKCTRLPIEVWMESRHRLGLTSVEKVNKIKRKMTRYAQYT